MKAMLPARFMLTMMGFFAFYNGFIYNDFLSISLNLFGSCYELKDIGNVKTWVMPKNDCVYPFGIDPVWSTTSN
jgi:V-type H+-transporting ATPase subunit a